MAGRPKGLAKTGGRKKGEPNKRTTEKTQKIEYVMSLIEETLEQDIAALKPNDRVSLWSTLNEYVRPKLARTELAGDKDNPLYVKEVNFNIVDDGNQS